MISILTDRDILRAMRGMEKDDLCLEWILRCIFLNYNIIYRGWRGSEDKEQLFSILSTIYSDLDLVLKVTLSYVVMRRYRPNEKWMISSMYTVFLNYRDTFIVPEGTIVNDCADERRGEYRLSAS